MKADPFEPQLLRDYAHFCRRFGTLDYAEFIELWHAADALIAEEQRRGTHSMSCWRSPRAHMPPGHDPTV